MGRELEQWVERGPRLCAELEQSAGEREHQHRLPRRSAWKSEKMAT